MKLVVEPMQLEDIGEVLEVDRESYSTPWPASAYRREILHNRSAHYIVLRELSDAGDGTTHREPARPRLPFLSWRGRGHDTHPGSGQIIGYAGMWMMVDESHVTTIAVRTEFRGRGFGELLLATLVEAAADRHARRVTLEVRVSNDAAQQLYRKYGFEQQGVRTRYYSDNNEDAYIMTTEDIRTSEYRGRFTSLIETLRRRLEAASDHHVWSLRIDAPPVVDAVEETS